LLKPEEKLSKSDTGWFGTSTLFTESWYRFVKRQGFW
jgi:hypothetical protein